MLLNILGWFWVITGILFLIKPEGLREKLKKKSVKKLKKFFFGITLALGLLLINATWGVPGFMAKLIMFFGFIGILKGIFFLKAAAADKLIEWFLDQPIKFYRTAAIGQIIFGAVILSV